MEDVQQPVASKTTQEFMQKRLADDYPTTRGALARMHGQHWAYAAEIVLHFMCMRGRWPRVADFGLTHDEAKHARRAVTTAYMNDLDAQE